MDKRFRLDTGCFIDMQENRVLTDRQVNNLLNELYEENKELQDTIETICKDFEESHGMDIRNADWFTAW